MNDPTKPIRLTARTRTKERGGTAITFALLLIPIMLLVGTAIDFARMLEYKSMLQAAVDEAALAGASVYTDKTQDTTAIGVATQYFNNAFLPPSLSVSAPTVTANPNGSINPALGNAPAYSVTVSASAQVATTLMSLVIPSAKISATATAGEPVVSASLGFTNVNSWACDGNTAYMYQVPHKANGTGYDFSKVPAFSVANGTTQGNYYEIGTSYPATVPQGKMPPGQQVPTVGVNQPIGIMLRNDTDGNKAGCGAWVSGANSWGAPNGATQVFYSSLIRNKQSPSEFTNYTYRVQVTSTKNGSNASITNVKTTLPPSIAYPRGTTIDEPIESSPQFNILATYLGINDPASGYSNCRSRTFGSGSSSTTTYTCRTHYLTSATSRTPNCSLFVETGVSSDYLDSLYWGSAPPGAAGKCYSPTDSSTKYAAPTCAQLSALATQSGTSPALPAAVFWWDDAGGVTPKEHYYSNTPQHHCSAVPVNGPGYGEDCLYKNNFFAALCTLSGGSGSGFTEVVLTR